jgi:hypothetical protein
MNTHQKIKAVFENKNTKERFETFLQMADQLQGKVYWYALRQAYNSLPSTYPYQEQLRTLFQRDEPERHALMTSEEQALFDKLPDTIGIYRGMTSNEEDTGRFGVIWAMTYNEANYRAYHFIGNPHETNWWVRHVHSIKARKADIVGYFLKKGRVEIIYLSPRIPCRRLRTPKKEMAAIERNANLSINNYITLDSKATKPSYKNFHLKSDLLFRKRTV